MVVGQFTQDVEILVIGAGPSGYTAAFRAAELGKTVAIVDRHETLGGECLHQACIPTKCAHFGVEQDGVNRTTEQLQRGLAQKCASLGIERLHGTALFENQKTVQITGEVVSIVRFRKAIIASGSSERPLGSYDPTNTVQVEQVYQSWEPSGSILIVGNNPDAIEAATYLQEHDVTILSEGPVLPTFDEELVKQVVRPLSKQVTIVNDVQVANQFEHIVLATYRPPLLDPLQLDAAQVEYTNSGIQINDFCQTSNPKIYAVGECAGCQHSASLALIQGRVAAEQACGFESAVDTTIVPQVVWSSPELAQCGNLSAGNSVSLKWGHSGLAVAMNHQAGSTKISFDPESQAVLGIGIVGDGATELIATGVLAMEMGASLYDLANTAIPHPTKSELLAEVARVALDSS